MSLATQYGDGMGRQDADRTLVSPAVERPSRRGYLARLSAGIAACESVIAGLAAAVTFSLLVLNIITRSLGNAVYWTDESAILAMVWMAFIAASLTIHHRSHISVTLLNEAIGPRLRPLLAVLVDGIMLTLMIVIGGLVWRWFDPVGLYRHGGDIAAFASETFNFMYEEPTMTIGIRKFWFWLVLPLFVVTASIHCLANLVDSALQLRGGKGRI